jgi:hypothetical protein
MNARTAFLAKAAGHVAMRVFLVRSHPSTDRGLGERKLMSGPASMMEDSAIDRTDIDGVCTFWSRSGMRPDFSLVSAWASLLRPVGWARES